MITEIQQIRNFLVQRAEKRRKERESFRIRTLAHARNAILKAFPASGEKVFLIGSLVRPYHFYPFSDTDIVVKNFSGDINAVQKQLEDVLDRDVDIIVYEKSSFKELIDHYGVQII